MVTKINYNNRRNVLTNPGTNLSYMAIWSMLVFFISAGVFYLEKVSFGVYKKVDAYNSFPLSYCSELVVVAIAILGADFTAELLLKNMTNTDIKENGDRGGFSLEFILRGLGCIPMMLLAYRLVYA